MRNEQNLNFCNFIWEMGTFLHFTISDWSFNELVSDSCLKITTLLAFFQGVAVQDHVAQINVPYIWKAMFCPT